MQLHEALDFYGVTDHGMFMGVAATAGDPTSDFSKYEISEPLRDLNAPDNRGRLSTIDRLRSFGFGRALAIAIAEGDINIAEPLAITRTAWADAIDAADRHNEPGKFTTFVAYEYTTTSDDNGSLHRNVIFKGSDRVPQVPFSRMHSRNPEDLWDWMDELREDGVESIAIPHNSNKSNGHMFKLEDWEGNPFDEEYAEKRVRNEPIVEIVQIKGTSETHPSLSNRDEWADFELVSYGAVGVGGPVLSKPEGGYAREAWRHGLQLEKQGLTNPLAFGVIGSSDTHTAAAQNDESNFSSKLGLLSSEPQLRGSVPLGFFDRTLFGLLPNQQVVEVDGESYIGGQQPEFGAAGLAGVWAEENTRDAIFAAFRRKETFATSGPRIRVRFFAGYGYPDDILETTEGLAAAYASGVPMGGELVQDTSEEKRPPTFAVWAQGDAGSAPLQRVQVIKGWMDESGETHEAVIDVACAGGVKVDPATQRCPDNDAKVDLSDCSISAATGDSEIRTTWSDPNYDPNERAFYYARVLENPTCRWNTWDAIKAGTALRSDLPATLQERAWSSPIWVNR